MIMVFGIGMIIIFVEFGVVVSNTNVKHMGVLRPGISNFG